MKEKFLAKMLYEKEMLSESNSIDLMGTFFCLKYCLCNSKKCNKIENKNGKKIVTGLVSF